MKYKELDYRFKLEKLQDCFRNSAELSEAIGVSRRSLPNWRDNPDSISEGHRLDIDVLYCKHFLIPDWDNPKAQFEPVLLPDEMANPSHFIPYVRTLSYGTIEIETGMAREDFERIIDEQKLPRRITRQMMMEAINTFLTHKRLWQQIIEEQEDYAITEQGIKDMHAHFMQGIRDNAGFYSKKIRKMRKLEKLDTTLPEDIPEEMNRWIFKYQKANSLTEVAKAHAHFITIHPFGDGNGRVGRSLMMVQCLKNRWMPPLLNNDNKAMYYATMEHAMVHGRHIPLTRLLHEASRRKIK